jgi:hypothetical protein
MASEKIVDIFDLKSEDINAWDIAWALSNINRYNGCTPVPWDVLSHTGMAYKLYMIDHAGDINPATVLAILLHDASEAYAGDIPRPIKALDQMAWYHELEDQISQLIFERFGLNWQAVDWETVKKYDRMSGQVELHWLKPTSNNAPCFQPQVSVPKMQKLGKARPEELIGLLYQGAQQFGAKDLDVLFAIPSILDPYIQSRPATQPQETAVEQHVPVDADGFPIARSRADLDNMRV